MLYRLTFIGALTTGLLCAGALQAQVFETSVGEVSVEKCVGLLIEEAGKRVAGVGRAERIERPCGGDAEADERDEAVDESLAEAADVALRSGRITAAVAVIGIVVGRVAFVDRLIVVDGGRGIARVERIASLRDGHGMAPNTP